MSKHRTPQEKKRDHYDRDHVVTTEYSIQKAWPRKKRHISQKARARTRDILKTMSDERDLEAYPPELVAPTTRGAYRKPIRSVRERVDYQLQLRRSRLGWNFFKYSPTDPLHRSRFAAFLRALVAEQRGEAVHHARIVRWWLDGSPVPSGRSMYPGRLQWLESFFSYEPEMKTSVLQWLDRTLKPTSKTRR
ncbi:MAG: hypothetical protein WAM82_31480 [Thermoanaerobaculia bacterium]